MRKGKREISLKRTNVGGVLHQHAEAEGVSATAIDFVVNMMNLVSKMMNFALQMKNSSTLSDVSLVGFRTLGF